MCRLALFSVAAVIALPPVAVRAESIEAQYVGGTRNAIPANVTGTLNLDDAKELRFAYGSSIYRIPYAQISGTEIQRAGDGRKLFGRVPLPSLTPWKRKQTLCINFKDAGDKAASVNFEVWSKDATLAESLLAGRKQPKPETQQAAAPDSWWGDRIWKTTRNQSTWASEKPADASQAPQTAAVSK